jgi:hypothetical protein
LQKRSILKEVATVANPEIIQTAIDTLPSDWAYTPVAGKKPLTTNWQNRPFRRDSVIQEVKKDRWTGIGALCGVPSGGLLFLDHDGASCDPLVERLSGQSLADALPETVSFTSGKPGRYQVVYRVSEEFWDSIKTVKKTSGVKGPDGEIEQLEFRWNGCQSVVCGIHPGTKQPYRWVNSPVDMLIADAPMWLIEQMLQDAPQQETDPKPTPKPSQAPYLGMDEIPLIKCIAPKHRDLIDSGEGEGGRDNAGIAIAMDLIGTEKHLRAIGQRFDGDARSLFEDYCSRCNPPLTGADLDRIWKSADKSTNGPTLDPSKIQGCIDAYFKRGQSKAAATPQGDRPAKLVAIYDGGGKASTNAVENGQPDRIDVASEVKRIVDSELPYDEELAEIQDLAKVSGFNSNDIKGRVKALKMAREAADDRQKAAQALPSLMAERARRLNLGAFLWGDGGQLASMLHQRASEMKMPVEHCFTALIPTSANFIPSGVETLVQDGFAQSLIFNAMILGATGDGKSHALKVALAAAEMIEKAERERYALLKTEFDSELERWNDTPKSDRGEKPVKPVERRRIYQNGTRESLMRLHSQNPNGLLWAKDEGEGFVASQNQYRSGKGDDVQQGLEDFNGGSYGKDLATDNNSYFIPNRKIQKLGTMHVTQLMKQLEGDDFADYRGDQARWLFCAVPFGERKLELQRSQTRSISAVLTQTLKALYEGLETLEPHDDGFGYLFDDNAYSLYAAYQHQLRDWCKAEVGSLSAAFPKMEQYCIRFAGWLHIINAKLANVQPDPMIDSRTMVAAIELTDFYIGQLRLIYASAVPGQALTGLMFEVQQFCQGKAKPLTAGGIRTLSRTLKAKVDTATMKQILAQLVQSGYGQMEGDRYTAFPDPVEPEYTFECEYSPE